MPTHVPAPTANGGVGDETEKTLEQGLLAVWFHRYRRMYWRLNCRASEMKRHRSDETKQ